MNQIYFHMILLLEGERGVIVLKMWRMFENFSLWYHIRTEWAKIANIFEYKLLKMIGRRVVAQTAFEGEIESENFVNHPQTSIKNSTPVMWYSYLHFYFHLVYWKRGETRNQRTCSFYDIEGFLSSKFFLIIIIIY